MIKLHKVILLSALLIVTTFGYAADRVNINTADVENLSELKGIGKSKAQAIINYRQLNGPFPSVAALIQVRGIGKLILQSNRDKMTVR